MGYSSILKTDFYKVTHMQQYNTGITHFTSYLTPRGSRFKNIDKMVVFGVANFVNEILYKDFNENFFGKHWLDIYEDLIEVLHDGLHYSLPTIKETELKIKKLHELGYLPIELNGLPEGTLCPMGVPAIEIRSTHSDFAWVAQSIESILSCEFWHPAISATMALEYKKIAKAAYDKTVDDDISHMTAMCDFSMRGQESYTSSVASGAAFLTSFYNCSTIESRRYIRENYNDTKPERVNGLTSTEHSVMCSDYAICGDERETFRRLLTEVYPDTSFAAVSDSYDFWNVVTNILPSLREEIEAHNGFIGIRHDSDEPVHALCGIKSINLNKILCGEPEVNNFEDFESLVYEIVNDDLHFDEVEEVYFEYKFKDITYKGVFDIIPYVESYDHKGREWIAYETTFLREERTPEDKGMVESLYELFGGYTNSKGYKVMNPKLKAVYGDSITIPRAKEIYKRLEEKGFAANNVSLGVGSFSMECLEEDGVLKPFTRDSFSIAVKATYCIYNDNGEEKEIFIYKDPKGCSAKKSLKGLCRVAEGYDEIKVLQGLSQQQYDSLEPVSLFVNYFKDGNVNKYSFKDIRNRMEDNI